MMTSPEIPYLTTDQMREVDRLMIVEFGIELLQMMENAGRALARVARDRFFDGDPRDKLVIVLAGSGGNGGGGLVCARNLRNWGALVEVYVTAPAEQLGEVPQRQLSILDQMDVPVTVVTSAQDLPEVDLVIDALIGYSLSGGPRGASATLIRAATDLDSPTLALDVPSGIDSTTGEVFEPALRAAATLTLALPKVGLRTGPGAAHVGDLYLADIGVPPELYARPSLGLKVGPVFAENDIVSLSRAPVDRPAEGRERQRRWPGLRLLGKRP